MRPNVLMDNFIIPTLKYLDKFQPGIDSQAARQMMLAIAAQESECGMYFKQLGAGPARGIWQVEPETLEDLEENYLKYKPVLASIINDFKPTADTIDKPLISCPMYCCAIARLCLYRYPEPMPAVNDKDAMFDFYKLRYNSHKGAATREEWNVKWTKYVTGVAIS